MAIDRILEAPAYRPTSSTRRDARFHNAQRLGRRPQAGVESEPILVLVHDLLTFIEDACERVALFAARGARMRSGWASFRTFLSREFRLAARERAARRRMVRAVESNLFAQNGVRRLCRGRWRAFGGLAGGFCFGVKGTKSATGPLPNSLLCPENSLISGMWLEMPREPGAGSGCRFSARAETN